MIEDVEYIWCVEVSLKQKQPKDTSAHRLCEFDVSEGFHLLVANVCRFGRRVVGKDTPGLKSEALITHIPGHPDLCDFENETS